MRSQQLELDLVVEGELGLARIEVRKLLLVSDDIVAIHRPQLIAELIQKADDEVRVISTPVDADWCHGFHELVALLLRGGALLARRFFLIAARSLASFMRNDSPSSVMISE